MAASASSVSISQSKSICLSLCTTDHVGYQSFCTSCLFATPYQRQTTDIFASGGKPAYSDRVFFSCCCFAYVRRTGRHMRLMLSASITAATTASFCSTMVVSRIYGHSCCMSGLIILLAGAAVFCKTKYLATVVTSITEIEFMTESDCGGSICSLRSFVEETFINLDCCHFR